MKILYTKVFGIVIVLFFACLTVSIDLIDHVLQLSLGGILTQWSHDCSKLLGGDGAVAILVE